MSWSPVSPVVDRRTNPRYSPATVNKHDIRFLLDVPSGLRPLQRLDISPSCAISPSSYSTISVPDVTPPHSPAQPLHPCKDCPFSANTPEELLAHSRSTHKIKPFACQVCDKTFAERGNANKHYRVAHLKQRNHRCQTCDRCFAFRDGLNRHISMVHLNQRPFECTECMCPRGPHSSSIPCTHICGMRFKQKSHRRRHVHSVHQSAGKRAAPHHAILDVSGRSVPSQRTGQVS